ncbi:MBL fold metallo-hydrolase [Clostridium estertheticum]|uniref:ComEC/Rec2 family competence protein n=1 Tax=Clostridium estertheticum TaxID=238834 RepID=UPI001CD15B6D|nr:ComEC/Rec2 family competence protein [Clostridium estertheticum]MBZ9689803.1 MBL fold metallo-hydrolase [Clostridium estertheticum]
MKLSHNKIFRSKWFQVVVYIFLVIVIETIYAKAAGWFVVASSIGLVTYQFFINEKFKRRKVILKIGVGIMLFMMFIVGIAMSNPLTMDEQKVLAAQQAAAKLETKQASEQATLDEKKAEEAKTAKEDAKKKEVAVVKPTEVIAPSSVKGLLKIHFIDVGQANSILIEQGNASMLIDAGNNPDSALVKNYISQQGITKLDYVVGAHPHEDHIGGLDYVINSFEIGKIYMPKATSNTKAFQDVVNAIKSKGMKATVPKVGESFKIGEATATILAPNSSSYEDINNTSIVIRLTFGNNSFMLDGDAEDVSENEMLSKGLNVKADLWKLGHHGSSSSTTQNMLDKVNPKYAIISVGKGNTYGHPTQSTMNKLKAKNISVFRTDENGTIVLTSDGRNITFNTKLGSYDYAGTSSNNNVNSGSSTAKSTSAPTVVPVPVKVQAPSNNSRIVFHTPTGKSYHYSKSCSTLSRSKTILSGTLGEALSSSHNYPCNICAGGN